MRITNLISANNRTTISLKDIIKQQLLLQLILQQRMADK